MERKNIGFIIASMVVYILLQMILFRNLAVFDLAFCYIYISAILLLPLNFDKVWLLLYAFLLGVAVDILYDSLGIHAMACVFIAYTRRFVLKILRLLGSYDENVRPRISQLGLVWFLGYALVLIGLHHTALFALESSNFSLFFSLFPQLVASIFFTLFMMILFQYLFYN